MTEKSKKITSEFAVNLISARWLCTSASQLMSDNIMGSAELEVSKKCHIYLVCERPAIRFDPNDFKFENETISGNVVYRVNGEEYRDTFENSFPLKDGAVRVALSPYPHREIHTFDDKGELIRYLPANVISVAQHRHSMEHVFRQLKVLYVGQSFAGGNRSAFVRLRSHATVQKILADAAYHRPDSEIMVLAVEYLPYRMMTVFNVEGFGARSEADDRRKFHNAHHTKIKMKQQVSLTEAALIKYFQPEYNKIYKKKFPSREMSILAECYKLDFSALIVELNTDELNFLTYSNSVQPSTHHIVNITLVEDEQRKSFFRFIDKSGAYTERSMFSV
jgi:hypothetical protein